MKRILYLKMTVDWEDYDDVCDELVLEDSGIFEELKEGVTVEQLDMEKEKKKITNKEKNRIIKIIKSLNDFAIMDRNFLIEAIRGK